MFSNKNYAVSTILFLGFVISLYIRQKISFLINFSYYNAILIASLLSLLFAIIYLFPLSKLKFSNLKPASRGDLILNIACGLILISSLLVPILPLGSKNVSEISQIPIIKKPEFTIDAAKSPEIIKSLNISDWVSTLTYDTNSKAFNGQKIEIRGFVSKHEQGGFLLSVYNINCCVVDVNLVSIKIVSSNIPPVDSWQLIEGSINVEGQRPNQTFYVKSTKQELIEVPTNPYLNK